MYLLDQIIFLVLSFHAVVTDDVLGSLELRVGIF